MVDVVEGSPGWVSETSLSAVDEVVSERGRFPSHLLVFGSQSVGGWFHFFPLEVSAKSLNLGVQSSDLLPKGAFLLRVLL